MKIMHRCICDVGHLAFALALAALMFLALPGCASTPALDQLGTVAQSNGAAVHCLTGGGLYGHGNGVVVHTEHASLTSGKLTVSPDCTVTIEATQGAPAK